MKSTQGLVRTFESSCGSSLREKKLSDITKKCCLINLFSGRTVKESDYEADDEASSSSDDERIFNPGG